MRGFYGIFTDTPPWGAIHLPKRLCALTGRNMSRIHEHIWIFVMIKKRQKERLAHGEEQNEKMREHLKRNGMRDAVLSRGRRRLSAPMKE